jgi:hypothetical protein
MSHPPLRALHAVNAVKITQFEKMTTEDLNRSLALGDRDCLKARPDVTIMDGHHRIEVLRRRNIDV